jgi:hypothetical protein
MSLHARVGCRNSLQYLVGLSEKELNHCSVWEICSIEKGTWTLTVLSIPATSCRGSMGAGGGCVDVDSCRSGGEYIQDWV